MVVTLCVESVECMCTSLEDLGGRTVEESCFSKGVKSEVFKPIWMRSPMKIEWPRPLFCGGWSTAFWGALGWFYSPRQHSCVAQ
eukprot:4606560-Karenia_brevis.AAC.1